MGQALATEAIAECKHLEAESNKDCSASYRRPGCVIFWMCEVPHTLAWETELTADMLAAMDGSVDRDVRDNR